MADQMADIERFVAKLRLDPSDSGGPSRMDMMRERQEAATLIESLASQRALLSNLELSMAIVAPALQMALEMESVQLPANGIADLKRGLELYRKYQSIKLR